VPLPLGWGSHISRHSAHEVGKVNLTQRPPLPQEIFLVHIYVKGWVYSRAIVRPEGCQWKIPVTPSGVEPATFRIVGSVICSSELNSNRVFCRSFTKITLHIGS
jgi:hypothetical protein